MRILSLTFTILFFSINIFADNTSERDRFNLMFNYSDSLDYIWESKELIKPKIDSSELIYSKHPIYYEAKEYKNLIPDLYYLKIGLYQKFVIPFTSCKEKVLEVSIHNKSIALNSLKLKIVGVDTLGNIVKTDSIDINSYGKWKKKSLKIHLADIRYFTIAISGEGTSETFDSKKLIPRLYLDRMSITIDGQSINQINEINDFRCWNNEVLNQKDLYPLSMKSISEIFFKEIDLNKKKVIALGEAVHGSKEINETVFQIAKAAIINGNCKLILNEMSLAVSMKINLFLHGKLAGNEITNIREEIRYNHIYMPAFIEFLLWLREYNKTAERKVFVLGLMDAYEFIEAPLYGYIFAFYNNDNKNVLFPLLKKLHKKNLKEALDFVIDNSNELINILNKDEFSLLKYALLNQSKIETGEVRLNLDNYDYYMWLNAKTFISEYLKEDESVLIYAHLDHVKKKEGLKIDPTIDSMGEYLNNYYKKDYCVVGITIGEGRITSRKNGSFEFIITDLEESGYGSIEKTCLQHSCSLFYYPSKKLLHNIYSIRDIGNKPSPFSENKTFNFLKETIDGLIFIRNSNGFNDNYTYSDNYFWDKGIERSSFLKKDL